MPGPHNVHAVALRAEEYFPDAQFIHVSLLIAFTKSENFPDGQLIHGTGGTSSSKKLQGHSQRNERFASTLVSHSPLEVLIYAKSLTSIGS